MIGLWDGKKIEWESEDEKYKHEKRVEDFNKPKLTNKIKKEIIEGS